MAQGALRSFMPCYGVKVGGAANWSSTPILGWISI